MKTIIYTLGLCLFLSLFPGAQAQSFSKNENAFPQLTCLKDNVHFWENVYEKIDSDQVYLHDKNNLKRVYKTITLPKNKMARERIIRREKKHLQQELMKLSNIVNSYKNKTPFQKYLLTFFPPNEQNKIHLREAADNIRAQIGLKTQFTKGVKRSLTFQPIVFPLVKKSGLPLDLAYLPHVESSYNSKAGSKVGARGLWQLMPSTMALLEGHRAVSKRTQPALSTVAAMKLLKFNFEKTGNWPLALTAYNHGLNGVLRAMDETNSSNLCTIIEHYNSPSFKFASSNFYAQFLAARNVASRQTKVFLRNRHTTSYFLARE
jgi:membrane-bound lytic murein transglycosylase D